MRSDELAVVLAAHRKWLDNEVGGTRANLVGANLVGAYLVGANLDSANLVGANLDGAYLVGANLDGANLDGANLARANLVGASLVGANLDGANLDGANLVGASLDGASLDGVDVSTFRVVPDSGSFRIWKKLAFGVIAELGVPADAGRVNAIGSRKIRVERAHVIRLVNGNGEDVPRAPSLISPAFFYATGDVVVPDSYDPDVRVECSHGIHGFLTRWEAENWNA